MIIQFRVIFLVLKRSTGKSTAEDACRICDAINQLNELKTLKLEGISLGIKAVTYL